MAVQGPLSGGTFTDDSTVGVVAWTNPGNAVSSNNSYAVASLTAGNPTSHYLRVTNFGFTIPSGANIDGVTVEFECFENVSFADVIDNSVRLYTGSFVGADKASATEWPTADAYRTYGGAADLWSATLSDTIVNASTFGVGISASLNTAFNNDVSIDHVRITINYTAAAGGGAAVSQTIIVGL